MPTLAPYYTILPVRQILDQTYKAENAVFRISDLDGDGYQDLVFMGAAWPWTAPTLQPWRVFVGDGQGNFTPAQTSIFPWQDTFTVDPVDMVVADFNADARPDAYVASIGWDANPFPGEQNRLYLSGADGALHDSTATLPASIDFTHSVAIGDVDRDGDLDIYVGNIDGQRHIGPYLLVNDGTGHFTVGTGLLPTGSGELLQLGNLMPSTSKLADVDGDGYPDLLLGGNNRSVVLWNKQGTFSGSAVTELPYWTSVGAAAVPLNIDAADFNGDGLKDIVLEGTSQTNNGWEIQVLINRGSRHFADESSARLDPAERSNTTQGQATAGGGTLQIVDFNRDGAPDIMLTNWNGPALDPSTPLVWLNDGSGHFTTITAKDFSDLIAGTPAENLFYYANTRMFETEQGWSFVFAQPIPSTGSLEVSVILATAPYFATASQLAEGSAAVTRAGSAASESLAGGGGADTMSGGGGNDQLRGGPGADAIDGGAGRDTAVYTGARANYTTTGANGVFTVTDKTGEEGADALVNVERLAFSDFHVALDIDGNAGMAYRLYQAAFARVPDLAGLGFQMNALDIGFSVTDVAGNFIASPEFNATYGPLDNVHFVTQLYQNVLHRAPDAGGLAYHVANLDGGVPRSYVLVGFSESPENKANVIGAIANGMDYIL